MSVPTLLLLFWWLSGPTMLLLGSVTSGGRVWASWGWNIYMSHIDGGMSGCCRAETSQFFHIGAGGFSGDLTSWGSWVVRGWLWGGGRGVGCKVTEDELRGVGGEKWALKVPLGKVWYLLPTSESWMEHRLDDK
ncbi:hypothetical protein EDD15DRAFT_2197622 [Pisolithus albus]|nr:hypothetical protein EDD15DRAFT_2197622 [Pisolithus albus]